MGDEVTEAPTPESTEVTTEETTQVVETVEDTVQAGDERVQTEGDESNAEDDVDPLEEYRKTWETEQLETLKKEAEEQVKQRLANEQARVEAERQASVRVEQAKKRFAEASKATAEALKSVPVFDEDGIESKLSDETIQQVVNTWNEYNKNVYADKEHEVFSFLADAIVANLPETAREEFNQRAANKPLPEYLKAFGELYAPRDDIRKEVEASLAEQIKAAEARGAARERARMKGTPTQVTQRSVIPDKPKFEGWETSLVQAAKALNEGVINPEQYRQVHRKLRG